MPKTDAERNPRSMSRQGEERPRTFERIREFWEAEADDWGESPQVTIRDHCFRIHELNTLLSLLPRCERLLDVGCGTGFGTIVLARRAGCSVGVDNSVGMVRWAERLRDDAEYRDKAIRDLSPLWPMQSCGKESLRYVVGDVVALDLPELHFDVVTGQRILINLPTHGDQMRALAAMRKHSSVGAMLILVEATQQGHARTDAYRARFCLPPLEKYWHNQYVDMSKLDDWEHQGWRVTSTLGFDTYMLLSKVVYPAACGPEHCSFLGAANVAAMELANVFRTQKAVDEIGLPVLLNLFVERVERANADEGQAIRDWLVVHEGEIEDFAGLGHQQLVIAKAC